MFFCQLLMTHTTSGPPVLWVDLARWVQMNCTVALMSSHVGARISRGKGFLEPGRAWLENSPLLVLLGCLWTVASSHLPKLKMAACEISAVDKNICAKLGEGPHWDTVTRKLLWVDSFDYKVHILDVETGVDKSYQLDGVVGSVVPRKRGGSVLVATQTSLIFLDLETGQKEIVATVDDDKPENHLNDGKCDSMGRFWVGSMGPEPEPTKVVPEQGTLFSFSGDRNLVKWVDKITISNGMTWSLDNKTFYYIDTATSKIDAFDYDEQGGSISNRRTAVKIDPLYGVLCCNPSSGEIVRQVDLPVAKVTSCCWGGPNLDELFVTCESLRLSPEERKAQPLAGSVLRVKNLGTHGFPAVAFNG